MVGLLTTSELTHALFKVMKGDSSPGIDGFTVNFIRVFWTDIKTIVKNALNRSFGNKLSSTLRTAIVKLLPQGPEGPKSTRQL
jgi:hypothetical protein